MRLRRIGIDLAWIRTMAFTLAGLTAGIGGIIYASRLRSISTSFDGGTILLYVVAAAVIGGTSLLTSSVLRRTSTPGLSPSRLTARSIAVPAVHLPVL